MPPGISKSMSVVFPPKSTDTQSSEALLAEKGTKTTIQWAPGHKNILRSSLLAVLGLLGSLSGALFVLFKCSKRTSIEDWIMLAPNVWLAISAIISNACLRHIIFEGSIVTWWQTAIRGNATIQALHQLWDSNSLLPALASLLRIRTDFNRLSLATIAVVIASTHGAFYQSAIATSDSGDPSFPPLEEVWLNVSIAETLPEGWSGRTDGINSISDIPFVSSNLSQVVHAHVNAYTWRAFTLSRAKSGKYQLQNSYQSGCGKHNKSTLGGKDLVDNGNSAFCLIFVRGPGFQRSPVYEDTYDYRNTNSSLDSADGSDYANFPYLGLSIDIYDQKKNESSPLMTFDVKYKSKGGCESIGTHKIFNFTPAIVTYAIFICTQPQGSDTMITGQAKDLRKSFALTYEKLSPSDSFHRKLTQKTIEMFDSRLADVKENKLIDDFNEVPETYSGFTAAMRYLYHSRVRFRPASNQEDIPLFKFSGLLANSKPKLEGSDPCSAIWHDPVDHISMSLDELMLRALLSVAQSNPEKYNTTPVSAVQQRLVTPLEVGRTFAIIALLLPLLGLLFVLPTYWQYWILGRKFTTSPIEVAKAFEGREVLKEADCNTDIGGILEAVGKKRVKYGVVPTSTDGEESSDPGQSAMGFYEVDGLEEH